MIKTIYQNIITFAPNDEYRDQYHLELSAKSFTSRLIKDLDLSEDNGALSRKDSPIDLITCSIYGVWIYWEGKFTQDVLDEAVKIYEYLGPDKFNWCLCINEETNDDEKQSIENMKEGMSLYL